MLDKLVTMFYNDGNSRKEFAMSRPSGVFKQTNEYMREIESKLYADTPKAVFAALLVSFLDRLSGGDAHNVNDEIVEEWNALYLAGIVPQKPPKREVVDDDCIEPSPEPQAWYEV
jgi:hypothetical protein